MYKKLRRNFMLVSTLVLLVVITAVAGIVYWMATNTILYQTNVLADLILENGGELPDQSEFNNQQETFLALSAETIHELRYYTATVRSDTTEIANVHIIIQESDAAAIARHAAQRRSDRGSITVAGGRRMNYVRQQQEDGSMFVVLLDCTSRYGLIRIVMMYMSALWFAVLVLYVLIMGRYSKKLVQPFIENDERQKRFITNASHELKTPLAVISANTEMTEAMGGKSKWTDSTRRQIGKLQSLIDDLVVLSRLDEMRELPMSDVDLSAVTAETTESFRSVIEGAGRQLYADITPDMHGRSEKRSFQQLVSILMDNAAKYCDDGGSVRVTLTPRSRGKGARLTVTNTYAGGKDVDYSKFFERFYREDASHNSAQAGFGIGLSMGKEIAERLGGRLRVTYAGEEISFVYEQ